jgi:hypothetical protein
MIDTTCGNKTISLIDTSIIGTKNNRSGIIYCLYEGNKGLDTIELDYILEEINRASRVIELIDNKKAITINEVITEIEHEIELLNKHHNFFQRNFKRARIEHKRDYNREEKIDAIRDYSNLVYRILHRVKNTDPRPNFTEQESRDYGRIKKIAYARSRDIVNKSLENKSTLRNPRLTGYHLETDQNLLSTALTLSLETEVDLYTNDNGMSLLKNRLVEYIGRDLIFRGRVPKINMRSLEDVSSNDLITTEESTYN